MMNQANSTIGAPERRRACCLTLTILALLAALPLPAAAAAPNVDPAIDIALAADSRCPVIIRLAIDAPAPGAAGRFALAQAQKALLDDLSGEPGLRFGRGLDTLPWLAADVDAAALDALASHPAVERIVADARVRGALAQSLPAIRAPYVIDTLGITGAGVAVGVIDTGIDLANPDFSGAILARRRFVKDSPGQPDAVQDDNGHGTHIAGIIASRGAYAPRGVAPASQLVIIKALDQFNEGYLSDVIAGIDWLIANHGAFPSLKFINLSLIVIEETSTLCPCDSLAELDESLQPFLEARDRALAAGIRIVSPTGNGGVNGLNAPACFRDVVAVGATFDAAYTRTPPTGTYNGISPDFPPVYDENVTTLRMAGFSNYGACVDFVAPGYLISSSRLDADPDAKSLTSFGTSMAVAHVVGALALLQQWQPAANGAQLLEALHAGARPVPSPGNPAIHYDLIDLTQAARVLRSSRAADWSIYR